MNSWNRTDLRALNNLILVMVAIIVSVANPEMRRFVCLQSKSCPSSQTTSTKVFIQNQPASQTPTTIDKPILTTSISDTQLVTVLDKARSERTDGHDKSQVLEFRNTATSYLAFNIYATWLIFKNPVKKGKASHKYNRSTQQIEGHEDWAFTKELEAFAIMLYYELLVPQEKILKLLQSQELVISAGKIAHLLSQQYLEEFTTERNELLKAGLASTSYQHIDDTGMRVNKLKNQSILN